MGIALHKAGFYNESNKYLDKALVYCADPMILNVIGKNYQALRCYHWARTSSGFGSSFARADLSLLFAGEAICRTGISE